MARQFTRGSRRKTQWAGFASSSATAVYPGEVVLASGVAGIVSQGFILSGGVGLLDEETTITRTIGIVSAQLDGTGAGAGEFGIGAIVARNEAVVAGVASLANPETDPDAEWLYYFTGHLERQVTSEPAGIATMLMPFDVRGQRIVRAGSTVVWIASVRGATMNLSVNGRYLVKLT